MLKIERDLKNIRVYLQLMTKEQQRRKEEDDNLMYALQVFICNP